MLKTPKLGFSFVRFTLVGYCSCYINCCLGLLCYNLVVWFVSISQVIGWADCLRNDLECVEPDTKPYRDCITNYVSVISPKSIVYGHP